MRKIILAIKNSKLEEKLKENNNIKIVYNNLQYREGILEVLEKNKNIDYIFINENIPGEISIEELIKKIKLINNKINIIIFLEKENINKIDKLKNLNIKNIYINKKININKIINLIIEEKNLKEKENNNGYKNNEIINKEKVKNKKKVIKIDNLKNIFHKLKLNENNINLNNKNKLITVVGKRKTGKSTIINLLLIYLLEKNKKILLINLNKKLENNYLILFGKKYYKIKNNNFKSDNKNKKNIFLKSEIKINNNLFFLKDFEKIVSQNNYDRILKYFTEYYKKRYDYVLIDIGNSINKIIKRKILEISDKKILVTTNTFSGIKEIEPFFIKTESKEEKKDLHIILNKYYFFSISESIFKNIYKNKIKIYKIFHNKNFNNLNNKILIKKKNKINILLKNKIKNILK